MRRNESGVDSSSFAITCQRKTTKNNEKQRNCISEGEANMMHATRYGRFHAPQTPTPTTAHAVNISINITIKANITRNINATRDYIWAPLAQHPRAAQKLDSPPPKRDTANPPSIMQTRSTVREYLRNSYFGPGSSSYSYVRQGASYTNLQ